MIFRAKQTHLLALSFLMAIFFLFFSASSANAAAVSWDGGAATTNWSDALNWSGDAVPNDADDVTINSNVTVNIAAGTTINSLTLGQNGGGTTPILNFNYDAISSGQLVINNDFLIYSGATLTHTVGTSLAVGGTIKVSVSGNFNLYSGGSINVSEKGYLYNGGTGAGTIGAGGGFRGSGGGGYGGDGGDGYGIEIKAGGISYGSVSDPTGIGSGAGQAYTASNGGTGGGAVVLTVTGTTTINGTINANGKNGGQSGTGDAGGGGSGGSINITTSVLTGSTGVITANGGNGGNASNTTFGGGGGGGRVALKYSSSNSYTGSYLARGGSAASAAQNGGAGTVLIKSSSADGDLYIDNSGITGDELDAETALLSTSTYDNLTVKNYAIFRSNQSITINNTVTLTANGMLQTYTGGNLSYSTFTWDTNTTLIDDGGTFDFISGGGSLTVPSGRTLNANTARTYTDVTINGNLKHGINRYTEVYVINQTTTGNYTIASGSTVNLDGMGYYVGYGPGKGTNGYAFRGSAGGGYGGAGGNGTGTSQVAGGVAYGSSTNPVNIGSGAGVGTTARNLSRGGGAIILNVGGTLTVNENITVNGLSGSGSGTGDADGGGAGGSINLTANQIVGGSNLSANGGNGYSVSGAKGGGGGGGRIHITTAHMSEYTGTISVTGGTSTHFPGQDGTNILEPLPQSPSSLAQYISNGTTPIPTATVINDSSVVLKVTMSAGGSSTLTPEIEHRDVGTSFTNIPTATGSGVSYSGTPVTGSVTVTDLPDLTSYHWQSRVCVGTNCSDWVSYGGSPYDFRYVSNLDPDVPSSLGTTSYVDGSYVGDSTPTLSFTLSDSDVADTLQYNIILDDSSDFSSPVVDYTSALAAQGATSFTVGQAAGSGTYSVGSVSQTLSDGSYYWKVKAIDNSSSASSYATANSGSVAFIVDTTAPTIPGTPSTATPTSDATPSWSWTVSSDSGSGLAASAYSVQWCQDNLFVGCDLNVALSGSNSYTHTSDLADAVWYLKVKALDAVSNQSSYSSAGTVTIDTTGPSISLTAYSPDPGTDTTPTISGTTTDTLGTISNVQYQMDGILGAWSSCVASDGSFDESTETFTCTPSALSDGSHTFYVRSLDNLSTVSSTATDSFSIDNTPPTTPEDISPSDNDYTRDDRPVFRWKSISGDSLSKYVLEVDNPSLGSGHPQGDFSIDNISSGSTTDYVTDKYVVHFENFSDDDNTNNYISVYTKSSSDWSQDSNSGENDGLLREGKVVWKLHSVDSVGNDTVTSHNLYVDRTSPVLNISQVNDFSYTTNNIKTSDRTLTLKGTLTDPLSGGDTSLTQTDSGPKIASGPKKVSLTIKKYQGNRYELDTSAQIDFTNSIFTCDGTEVSVSTWQNCNKQNSFEFALTNSLTNGLYLVSLHGEDTTGNGTDTEFNLTVGTTSQIVEKEKDLTPEEEDVAQNTPLEEKPKSEITEVTLPILSPTPSPSITPQKSSWLSGVFKYTGSVFNYGFQTIKLSFTKPTTIFKNIGSWLSYTFTSFGEIVLDQEPTKISNVKVQILDGNTAVVTWTTNHHATSKVNYGDSFDYGLDIQSNERVLEHRLEITNLQPDTTYYYEVMSQGKNYVYDARHEFKTNK